MSIQSEIDRLKMAKSGLATAITGKGVTVPGGAMLSDYPALVDQIQTGGGLEPLIGTTETVTPAQVVEAVRQGRQVVLNANFNNMPILFSSWNSYAELGGSTIVFSSATLYVDETVLIITLVGVFEHGWFPLQVLSGQGITPSVTSSDAGKFLRVDSTGQWAAESVPSAEEVSF